MPLTYKVIVDADLVYSIWPSAEDTPQGWQHAGMVGSKEQVLAAVGQTLETLHSSPEARETLSAGLREIATVDDPQALHQGLLDLQSRISRS